MVLELAADAEVVASLSRLKALAACREGRPRTQPVKIVWHDSPEHTLLADGLTLAEQRGVRRLERVYPGSNTWLPAQPVPVVAEAPDAATLPAPLAPLAAFEGRQTISVHRIDDRPVVVRVAKGILRAVTAEQPAARIWLSGEGQAVRTAALLIADTLPVAVPIASMAAEAIALATGRPPRPRHEGPPALPREEQPAPPPDELCTLAPNGPPAPSRLTAPAPSTAAATPPRAGPTTHREPGSALPPNQHPPIRPGEAPATDAGGGATTRDVASQREVPQADAPTVLPAAPHLRSAGEKLSVTGALTHILGHLIDVVLSNAQTVAQHHDTGPDPVHQMRVAVRRARSALAIFRTSVPAGALDAVRGNFKELGHRLAPTRDWDVFVEETAPAVRAALPDDERLARLIAAASRRQRDCRKALATYLNSKEFRILCIELAWFTAARFWHPVVGAVPAEPANPPPLEHFARSVLQNRWKKLLAAGKRIEELDVASLHGVRLRAKRARYAAEMFSTLYQGKPLNRSLRRLSVLQQRLGVMNDGAVATHLLAELGGPSGRHAYATGVVIGFLAARSEKIRPRIERAFERFRHHTAYWA